MNTTIFNLQNEIIEHVFFHLTPPDILRCKLVCKVFSAIGCSNVLWKYFCSLELNQHEIDNMLENNNFYDLYVRWYCIRDFINKTSYFVKNENNSATVELYKTNVLQCYPTFIDYNAYVPRYPSRISFHSFRSEIRNIPKSIKYLKNLLQIELNYHFITSIPIELSLLHNLKSIDFSRNSITIIPVELSLLHNLKSIDLSHNLITSIPPQLSFLHKLENIKLSFNIITSIPKEICSLPLLVSLNIEYNNVRLIPHSINLLTSLTDLNLSNNRINYIPLSLYKLNNANIINLSYNSINNVSNYHVFINQHSKVLLIGNPICNSPNKIFNDTVAKHFIFN